MKSRKFWGGGGVLFRQVRCGRRERAVASAESGRTARFLVEQDAKEVF